MSSSWMVDYSKTGQKKSGFQVIPDFEGSYKDPTIFINSVIKSFVKFLNKLWDGTFMNKKLNIELKIKDWNKII